MVTRLTRQKGLDLVMYALDRILAGGVQVAVLGTGDRDYEDGLRYFQDKYPGTMAARIEFDPGIVAAHVCCRRHVPDAFEV